VESNAVQAKKKKKKEKKKMRKQKKKEQVFVGHYLLLVHALFKIRQISLAISPKKCVTLVGYTKNIKIPRVSRRGAICPFSFKGRFFCFVCLFFFFFIFY